MLHVFVKKNQNALIVMSLLHDFKFNMENLINSKLKYKKQRDIYFKLYIIYVMYISMNKFIFNIHNNH